MMTTLLLAWRNIWRNTRRTLITALAIGLGLGTMLFSLAWMVGMNRHLVETLTASRLGQAQIHAPGFRQTRQEELTIPQGRTVLKQARSLPKIAGAAPRLFAIGLAAMGDRSVNVELMGVDLDQEPKVTNWRERLVAGAYPAGPNQVLLGDDLARRMELEVGSKLVLTVARVGSGDLEAVLTRVAGVVYTGNPSLDKRTVIAPLGLVQKIIGLPGAFHEIALRFRVDGLNRAELGSLLAPLEDLGLDVQAWPALVPVVASMLDLQGLYLAISVVLIFGLVAFGIVNTMSMSLLERFKEFGVLRAIGTSPPRLAGLILAEAGSIGIVGCALGLGLGAGFSLWLGRRGVVLGGVEAMGVSFGHAFYPSLDPVQAGVMVLVFLVLTPLVALGPALRAARVEPVRALRHE
jgi:ABC-type lipoprotein release transport system permease subunit